MRILVTGSRDWRNARTILDAIRYQVSVDPWQEVTVVHGGARGADQMAGIAAYQAACYQEVHPADWEKYGRRAGFVRNAEMVNAGADVCLAFIRNNSKGATMCAQLAEKAGIPVVYYRDDE